MLAGIYNIMVGLALFLLGLGFLLVYGQKERKLGNGYPVKRTLISLGILLFNFPAAALALYSAEYLISTSTATVINNSSFEVTDMVLIERA
jgi:drug/metabolite transporter (DMT)-like permease